MADLSYPNISFTESTVGPTPQTRPWRDRIGVIGEFSRGPVEPREVSSREEIVRLYGEGSTPASLQIQDALQLGATNYTIVRAVPQSTAATAKFFLGAGNPDLEPLVGYESVSPSTSIFPDSTNYTVGLSLDLNFVSSAVVQRDVYEPVKAAVTKINHATLAGRANLQLHVTDYVDAGSRTAAVSVATETVKVETAAGSIGSYQYVLLAKANSTGHSYSTVKPFIRPGYSLRLTGATVTAGAFVVGTSYEIVTAGTTDYTLVGAASSAVGTVFTATGIGSGTGTAVVATEMLVVSSAINHSTTKDAYVVKNLTATTATTVNGVAVYNPSKGNYILGYTYEAIDSTSITAYTAGASYFSIAGATYTDATASYPIDAYVALPVDGGGVYTRFGYLTTASTLTAAAILPMENFGADADEGLQLQFGADSQSAIALIKGGHVTVSFAHSALTLGATTATGAGAFTSGTSASSILRSLEAAVNGNAVFNSLIADAEASLLIPPYSFTLTSKLIGTEANRIFYKLTRYVAGTSSLALDILFKRTNETSFDYTSYGSYSAFADGFQGPTFAYRDFYALNGRPILRVQAISPGVYGNSLQVTLVPGTTSATAAQFQLSVVDNNINGAQPESYRLSNAEIDANGVYLATVNSPLIRAYFIPVLEAGQNSAPTVDTYLLQPLRQAPPLGQQSVLFNTGATSVSAQAGAYIRAVSLTGATDYSPSTLSSVEARKRGFLSGVIQMADQDVAYVTLPGLSYGDGFFDEVFTKVKADIESSNVQLGLRLGLFEPVPGIPARQAAALATSLDSERIKLIVGHSTSRALDGNLYPRVGSSLKAAALMATRPPRISLASTYGSVVVPNVVSVDTKSTSEYLETISAGHADALFYDAGIRAFKFLNGVTTSSDPNKRYDSVRRILDQLISDLYFALQWVRSEPNTRELQRRISAAANARLSTGLRDGDFIRIAPAICGPENNSEADMISGKVYITIRVTPVFPADFFKVNVIRDLSETFSIDVGSNSMNGF
jgi:hypothetical protein